MDWQWFTLTGWHKFHLRNVGEGKFEIVVLVGIQHACAIVRASDITVVFILVRTGTPVGKS